MMNKEQKKYLEDNYSCPLCGSKIVVVRLKVNSEVMAKCVDTYCDFTDEFDLIDYEILESEMKSLERVK